MLDSKKLIRKLASGSFHPIYILCKGARFSTPKPRPKFRCDIYGDSVTQGVTAKSIAETYAFTREHMQKYIKAFADRIKTLPIIKPETPKEAVSAPLKSKPEKSSEQGVAVTHIEPG